MENSTKEIIELTKELIKFKTTKENPTEIKKCMSFIKKYFSKCDVIIKEFEHKGKLSLFISYKETKKPKLLLNGHIDVVAADGDQYTPKIKNNKLYGRGSADMKAGVATYIVLMKEFLEKKPDMGLMIVSDEEMGGFDGTNYLINDKDFEAEFVLGAEPNHVDSLDKLNITTSEKGVLWLKITTLGKSCHASRPWLGDNALEKLIERYEEIKKLFPKTTEKNRWKTTINLSKINVDNPTNRVPDKAEMVLDIRYTAGMPKKEILDKIKKIKDIKIEILEHGQMLINDENLETIKKLKSCIEKTTGKECKLLKEHGSSDLRFTSEKKIPSVIFGPYGENYHGKDEFVSIESLNLFYKVMKEFISTF